MPGSRALSELFLLQADIARGRTGHPDCRRSFDGTGWRCARGWTSWNVADDCYSNQFSSVRGVGRSRASCMEDVEENER